MKTLPPLAAVRGVLLGTLVGDTIGLPYEGLSPGRIQRWAPASLEQAFVAGRGMVSDDTEHTVLLAHALAGAKGPEDFQRRLAWGLRGWLLTLPGGVGLATLRSTIKLCVGVPPKWSGVSSAGNGPAMRAALLGVCVPPTELARYVAAATHLTHTDPRAESGALAVALAAGLLMRGQPVETLIDTVATQVTEPHMRAALERVAALRARGASAEDVVAELGLTKGVTGFVMHTVPVALFVAATAPDVRTAIETTVRLGGDTDSVGAIVGALVGVRFGADAIPRSWLDRVLDWPASVTRLEALARALHTGQRPPRYHFVGALLRNLLVFLPLVLGHGLRRLLPPYASRTPGSHHGSVH